MVAREFVHDKEKRVVVITDGDFKLVLSEQQFREVNKNGCSGILMDLHKKKQVS